MTAKIFTDNTWLSLLRTCFFVILLSLVLASSAVESQTDSGQTAIDRYVSIDFNNVDIEVFIKFISELTGKNFVVNQRVKGKVTIISPSKISVDEAYKVFESVLEVHGFTTVQAGEIIKIVPSPDARTKSIETILREQSTDPDDKVVTQLIPLRYADPQELKRLLAPLISKSSVILAYPLTNTLIITDIESNIRRLLKIIGAIDVEGVGYEIAVIPLEHADAKKLERLLATVFRPARGKGKAGQDRDIKFVADERTNSMVVRASEDETKRVKALLTRLDKKIPRGKERIRVYYLEHASAEDLAKTLQSLSTKSKATPTKGKKEAPLVSEKVNITADKATNSLIIMAEKDEYQVLEDVIKKLDIPRAMVYIESLIMEVNIDRDFRLGTEWLGGAKGSHNDDSAIFGAGFGGGTIGGDPGFANVAPTISGVTATPLPSGFSVGMFGQTIQVGNIIFPSLSTVIQAYKKDKDIHILSTPQLLTTDNEEAKISVGKNVPYQTRTGTTSTSEVYNTYEYRDVAIGLTVTPQISVDRLIRLKIIQEVSKLESKDTDVRPTTLKRTVDTTVLVNDGHTVVIGGLIDDSLSVTDYSVPCLGSIPLLKYLFKSEAKARERTNLLVFLTPHVIQNPDEAKAIYEKKKDYMDSLDERGIKLYRETQDALKTKPLN